MFMNYKRERLIHNAVPNKEGGDGDADVAAAPIKIDSDDTPTPIQPQVSKPVITDLMPLNKDKSILTVNHSPIAGLQFLNPVEKKQNKAPYIEIFTRVYDTPTAPYAGKKLNILTESLAKTKDKIKITDQKTVTPNILSKSDVFSNRIANKTKAPKTIYIKKIDSLPVNKQVIPEKVQSMEIIESGNELTMQCDKNEAKIDENHQNISEKNIIEKVELLKPTKDVFIVKSNEVPPIVTINDYMIVDKDRKTIAMRNNKLITSLKAKVNAQQRRISRLVRLKQLSKKRESASDFQPMSKASLYAQIVPYLSPQLAQTVHKEMFPTFYK